MNLGMSDGHVRKMIREEFPHYTEEQVEDGMAYIRRRRDEHPYYLEPETPNQSGTEIWQSSTGTNYELAKMIALHSRSYVMTDLPVRWKEIEVDRAESGIDSGAWSPFAKAFDGLPFRFLDRVPLEEALRLRREGRLRALRDFLRKTWNGTSKAEPFDEANIANLAAELGERVREAEAEWKKIDRELLNFAAGTAVAAIGAAGPAIASGHIAWVGAAAAVAGAGALLDSGRKRDEYKLRYPAGFFVDLEKRHDD
jgi:hypothetical protein